MIKKILIALVVLVAGLCAIIDHQSHVGIGIGLGLGFLLGPLRIAGVDFRQWFRDPGAPSELGDDSWIGLMRGGSHALGWAGGGALVGVAVVVWLWPPSSCPAVDVGFLPAWVPTWVGSMLKACSGGWAFWQALAGVPFGVAIPQAMVEAAWRIGLRHVPRPARPQAFLAPQSPPRLRPKVPRNGARRLIVCCDGTWNWPDGVNETNVIRLVRAIKPEHNGVAQIVHYHQGVGTGNFVDRLAGGSTGVGLAASVKACYGFLVDNYEDGDEIFLFGFSRGAYIARALGGMIGTVGLLRKEEMTRFTPMWNWYWQKERDQGVLDQIAPRRHQDVDVECIGVWDTVGALGIPGSRVCASAYEFFQAELGPHVRHAFQALAIDERRGNFQGAIWAPYDARRPRSAAEHQRVQRRLAAANDQTAPLQVIKQVWFPGVHSNVGGGYPAHGMSDTTFIWMLAQVHGRLGLHDDCIAGALDTAELEQYPGGKPEDSRSGGWRLIGCPVPRPVCVVSDTEWVHESAWERSKHAAPLVPATDIYKTDRRREWLDAMASSQGPHQPVEVARDAEEVRLTGLPRPPAPNLPDIPPPRDICSMVLGFLGPRGG